MRSPCSSAKRSLPAVCECVAQSASDACLASGAKQNLGVDKSEFLPLPRGQSSKEARKHFYVGQDFKLHFVSKHGGKRQVTVGWTYRRVRRHGDSDGSFVPEAKFKATESRGAAAGMKKTF